MSSLEELKFVVVLLPLATLCAALVSGVTGMVGGMLLMAVLGMLLPIGDALILHGITYLATNIFRTYYFLDGVDWRAVAVYSLGTLVSVILFIYLEFVPNRTTLFLCLGIVPFVALSIPPRFALSFYQPRNAFFCGVLTTAMQLLCGVASGVMDVFFLDKDTSRFRVLGTKSATQVVGNSVKIFYVWFLMRDAANGMLLFLAPMLVVSSLAGIMLSRDAVERMSNQRFHSIGRVLLAGVGASVLLREFVRITAY